VSQTAAGRACRRGLRMRPLSSRRCDCGAVRSRPRLHGRSERRSGEIRCRCLTRPTCPRANLIEETRTLRAPAASPGCRGSIVFRLPKRDSRTSGRIRFVAFSLEAVHIDHHKSDLARIRRLMGNHLALGFGAPSLLRRYLPTYIVPRPRHLCRQRIWMGYRRDRNRTSRRRFRDATREQKDRKIHRGRPLLIALSPKAGARQNRAPALDHIRR
jgi:hypothetical protein